MNRKEFIEKSLLMGLGLPFLSQLLKETHDTGQAGIHENQSHLSERIIIVGAGAAGLTAGYLLKRLGADFTIIEAAPVYGGRLKKSDDFTDFPLDLGAEWIHTHPEILERIIDNPAIDVNIETMEYNPKSIKTWKKGRLKSHNYIRHIYGEWKFKNTTWFEFFEHFIIPDISDQIILGKPVSEINYESGRIRLRTMNNEIFEADKVLVTCSVKTLQSGQITFNPPLPESKQDAINRVFMGDGIKIFVEFRERFYPDIIAFGNIFQAFGREDKFVYDAALGKDSESNILGLFAINEPARAYTGLENEAKIVSAFLAELDEMFEGKATPNYVKHIVQNWSAEPYIMGSYSYTFDGSQKKIVGDIAEPVLNKIFFTGEALSLENQAMVHGACESAHSTVLSMLEKE